jgi:hypothetical protein
MRILIIAVNHQIQPAQIKSMSSNGTLEDFERSQKENFGEYVREHIRKRGVQFVGEEARHGEETIAQRICQQEERRRENIDMTPDERKERNIPPGYYEDVSFSESEKTRCNQEREEYMAKRVHAEDGKADSVIAICGRVHAAAIASRLSKLGHSVDILDLRSQPWYIEDWQSHMLQL